MRTNYIILLSVFLFLFSWKEREIECEVTPEPYQSVYEYGDVETGLIVRIDSLPEHSDSDRCKGVFINPLILYTNLIMVLK